MCSMIVVMWTSTGVSIPFSQAANPSPISVYEDGFLVSIPFSQAANTGGAYISFCHAVTVSIPFSQAANEPSQGTPMSLPHFTVSIPFSQAANPVPPELEELYRSDFHSFQLGCKLFRAFHQDALCPPISIPFSQAANSSRRRSIKGPKRPEISIPFSQAANCQIIAIIESKPQISIPFSQAANNPLNLWTTPTLQRPISIPFSQAANSCEEIPCPEKTSFPFLLVRLQTIDQVQYEKTQEVG